MSMSHRVVLIPGDGIGPEIAEAALRVISLTGVRIEWVRRLAGVSAIEAVGNPIPDETLEAIRECQVALKGPLTTPVGGGFRSVNVAIRQEFDLYANLRPSRNWEGIPGHWPGTDLLVVRENTEGLYSGVEHWVGRKKDTAEVIGVFTRFALERISRFAFDQARKLGRRRVTAVHKANILKLTNGMFLDTARAVAAEYPDIAFDDRIIDNMCLQLVRDPTAFDVILTTNLFGDILSDLTAGLTGGLGIAPSANIGTTTAVFEAVHGSAPDIAGRGIANPTSLILSACLLLDHLGEPEAASRIRAAVAATFAARDRLTRDLESARPATTVEFVDALVSRLHTA
ncbi:MAG: isocitrate dehydrogenase (NAD+) [bacterium]|nr:MAG: isocitrate dehydrogenase (NAD+) [bacterium]